VHSTKAFPAPQLIFGLTVLKSERFEGAAFPAILVPRIGLDMNLINQKVDC
jgi:hypothetical protein